MRKILPSKKELDDLLEYNPETGDLLWKKDRGYTAKRGSQAGYILRGYRRVRVGKAQYEAHRLIWKIQTGKEPPEQIDHKDGNGLNNRWDNLRDGSGGVNSRNVRVGRNNTSGIAGVYWSKCAKKWQASVMYEGVRHHLGLFEEKDEAFMEILEFRADKEGFTPRHGVGETCFEHQKASRND